MLITSISGIRGTIGGKQGENLTPRDVVNFASAYGSFVLQKHKEAKIVLGRDARSSGEGISQLIARTLQAQGIDIIDCGMVPTPTIAMMVTKFEAQGGIIITASHNPQEYNGIKMLNESGEFLSDTNGKEILNIIEANTVSFADAESLGLYDTYKNAIQDHIDAILKLDIIDTDLVASKNLRVVFDPVNSVGSLALPLLFDALGVSYTGIHTDIHGGFDHTPEPLEQNLTTLKEAVTKDEPSFGISVDPDGDRLVLVSENGSMFGEEYTLVACTDMVLKNQKGSIVTNMSSSQVTKNLAQQHGVECFESKVGEKNVVEKMKEVNALVGGEGSGGVIYPPLHYGRDALVGVALICMLLAKEDTTLLDLSQKYPRYEMYKDKIGIEGLDKEEIFRKLKERYAEYEVSDIDGVKVSFEDSWVHVRASNTEPIMRIYTEAKSREEAEVLAKKVKGEIGE